MGKGETQRAREEMTMRDEGPEGEILLLATVLRTGAIAGECELLAILRMALGIATENSLVPGTGPA